MLRAGRRWPNAGQLRRHCDGRSDVYDPDGNGLWLQSHFKPLTGEIDTRQSGTGGSSTNVQNLSFTWDTAGNLKVRQDLRQGISETFDYDALNRMWRSVGPAGTFTVGYNAIGNVTSRSDVNGGSTWAYHATKKNAVTAAGSNTYGYDANGNVQTRNGVTQTWTSANLPASLTSAGLSTQFSYAPDRSRWKQVANYSGVQETTLFIGGLLEKHTTSTPLRTHWKHLIATPSGEVQHVRRDDSTTDTFYLPSDHLGSSDAVLNSAGTVLVRTSFDAWGKRRDDDWVGTPSSSELQQIANTTRHGFTGHDMLDNIGLVHMNGRVYDPTIGRFLSADPFVVPTLGTQGFNRYSYVGNAPLSHIDPSGFIPVRPGSPDSPNYSDDWDILYPGWDLCFGYCADPGWFITVGDRGKGGSPNGGAGSHGGPVDGNPFNNPKNGGFEEKEEFSSSVTADHINVSTNGGTLPSIELQRAIHARKVGAIDTAGQRILDTLGAPWGGWEDMKYVFRCVVTCPMPGIDLEANLAGLPMVPIVGVENATARLAVVAQRGVSVLGRHPAYLKLGESIPSRYFNVPKWIWDRMSPAMQLAANTRFLDRLITRGDEVLLATNAATARAGTYFAWEIEYLTARGYTISADGWRLLPPGMQ